MSNHLSHPEAALEGALPICQIGILIRIIILHLNRVSDMEH